MNVHMAPRHPIFHLVLTLVFLGSMFSTSEGSTAEVARFPSKPVRLLMGPAAGGPTDGLGRRLASRLSEMWGQPVVVDNRPGAGNTIATTAAAKANPDGYTLLLCPLSDAVAPAVYQGLRYDFLKDITGIAKIGTTANVFVVHPSLPIQSVKDFIDHAKRNPGKLNYGAQGIGQAGHLSMELLKSMAGNINIVYVPYRAAGILTVDLLAGRIDTQITNLPSHLENIRVGKLRALGVTTLKRNPRLPDVPSISETIQGFDVTTWYGICAPAGVPASRVKTINSDIVKALNTPELTMRLEQYGVDLDPSTPEGFAAMLTAETNKWKAVVTKIGIPVQKLAERQ
jgi:tripartite-type tricarboxylate transporter receptor subunit TctC